MGRKYNFIIFGATGVTGKYLVEEIIKTTASSEENKNLKPLRWAVSGRSKIKLNDLICEISEKNESENFFDVKNVDIIVADVCEEASIQAMAKECDVLFNCVGPYLLYGEVVVKACVEQGTHYIDACYEASFFKVMNSKYNKIAETNGCYIVSACGYASIPADYGSVFLQKQFQGRVDSIEAHSIVLSTDGQVYPRISYGTYSSVITMSGMENELKKLYEEHENNECEQFDSKFTSNRFVKYTQEINCWSVRVPSPFDTDKVMMDSTQQHKITKEMKPVKTLAFFQMPNLFMALLMAFVFYLARIIPKFRFAKYLLLKYPKLFTLGRATESAPSHKEIDAKLGCTVVLRGWDKNTLLTDDSIPPNKTSIIKVEYTNAYLATAKMMLEAGVTLLTEQSKLPNKGGIYSPGFAFGETSLAQRLQKTGITFTIEEIDDDDPVLKEKHYPQQDFKNKKEI